jgi:serine/threonine protein kinase
MLGSDLLILNVFSSNNQRIVYKAKEKKTNLLVVVKRMKLDLCDCVKEVSCIDEVNSQSIIKCISHFRDDKYLYIITELAKATVGQILQNFKKTNKFFVEEVFFFLSSFFFLSLYGIAFITSDLL